MVADIIVRTVFTLLFVVLAYLGYRVHLPEAIRECKHNWSWGSTSQRVLNVAYVGVMFLVPTVCLGVSVALARTPSRFHPEMVRKEKEKERQESQRVLQEAAAKGLVPNIRTCSTCGDIHKCK